MDFNTSLEPQQAWNHELGTICDGIDSRIFDYEALVADQQALKRLDDCTEVAIVAIGIILPLSVKDIVHSDKALLFGHGTAPHAPKLLHVCAHTHQIAKMLTESTNVSASFTAHPEHGELSLAIKFDELAVVDGTDTKLTLNCRDERRTLEDGSGAELKSACELRLPAGDIFVEANDGDVFFSCSLLGFDKPCRAVDAHDQAAGDFGIESAAVAGLFHTQDALDPSDDLVGGRVGGFVEIDNSKFDIFLD